MNLTTISVKRPVTTLMFFIALIILGIVSLNRLSIDFLPDISVPSLTIKTIYPYASPAEVETSVTEPVESRVNTAAGVKRTSSISREGVSIVTVDFNWGVNMDYAMLEIREKLDQVRGALPIDVQRPVIMRIDPSTESMMTIVISRKAETGYDNPLSELAMLKEFARSVVKRRMEQIDGVAMAEVTGGVEREIDINIFRDKIDLFHISLSEIESAVKEANINIPGGTIKQGYFKLSLRTIGEFVNLDDIRSLVIRKNKDGSVILLKDVAEVKDTYKERTGITKYNSAETVGLLIHKEAGANTIQAAKKIHEVIKEINKDYKNLDTKVIFDQSEFISKSISDVMDAVLQGAFLAFIILFVFLKDIRSPFIIGITTPLSILITFILMDLFHVNINIISLTGLALGIGMLGDNAIVIIENTTRLREGGMPRIQAAIEGGKEINLAAAVSTFTNVAIFLPVLYVQGIAKEIFKDMALTMTFSLLASLLSAIMLVPMLISREKRENLKKISPFLIFFQKLFKNSIASRYIANIDTRWERIKAWFDKKIEWMLIHRKLLIYSTLIMFLSSLLIAYFIPAQSTPEIDQQRFTLEIQLPKGSSLEAVVDFTSVLEKRILTFPEVEAVITRCGIVEEQSAVSAMQTSPERAVMEIKIKEEGLTQKALDKTRNYINEVRKQKNGINISLMRRQTTFEQILRPEPFDLKIMVQGKNLSTASDLADTVLQRISSIKGLTDQSGGMQKGNPEYRIELDREKCALYDIPISRISSVITALTKGMEISEFNDFDKKIGILLKMPVDNINEIFNYKINTTRGEFPLKEFCRYELTSGFSEIWRESQNRIILITANAKGISVSDAVSEAKDIIKNLKIPDGYSITIGGENEEIMDSFRRLFIILILSVVLVYILLAAEFESLKVPLVIILTSPLAFMGAIFAMAIAGESYNLMSLIGIVIMVGAVDNDAVIALDFIIHLRREGMEKNMAIREGMVKRLRSIIMTTATTILGALPLLFTTGESSSLAKSLSYPVVGGLLTSTVFTLILIPVVYSYIDKGEKV